MGFLEHLEGLWIIWINQIICSAESHFCGSFKTPMSVTSCCYERKWVTANLGLWCFGPLRYEVCQFVFEAAVATFVKLQKHSNASQSPVNYLVSLRSLSEDRHPDIMMLHFYRARVNCKITVPRPHRSHSRANFMIEFNVQNFYDRKQHLHVLTKPFLSRSSSILC